MCGRHIDKTNPLERSVTDLRAFDINRHRNDLSAGRLKGMPSVGISGILDADSIAWIKEYARTEIECFKHARNDEHLLGFAPHSAPRSKVIRHSFTQRLNALGAAAFECSRIQRARVS